MGQLYENWGGAKVMERMIGVLYEGCEGDDKDDRKGFMRMVECERDVGAVMRGCSIISGVWRIIPEGITLWRSGMKSVGRRWHKETSGLASPNQWKRT